VKQIVGGSLSGKAAELQTNFVSDRPASWYAQLYARDGLRGGHVIKLGPGNDASAESALKAYPGGLQVGGGVNADNARAWLASGASHVIVTSWVFREGRVDWERLEQLVEVTGRKRLVLDLSCRKQGEDYFVVTDRWQKFTTVKVNEASLKKLAVYADEFLIHAADVEGLCQGIDIELVRRLADCTPIPTTYAGGARSMDDLDTVTRQGQGRIHLTIGSALDIFGGTGVRYEDVVRFNQRWAAGGTGQS
jgi:phosphoribosylformimino-5-aminoimidazole carboxamide ribotide isomerase